MLKYNITCIQYHYNHLQSRCVVSLSVFSYTNIANAVVRLKNHFQPNQAHLIQNSRIPSELTKKVQNNVGYLLFYSKGNPFDKRYMDLIHYLQRYNTRWLAITRTCCYLYKLCQYSCLILWYLNQPTIYSIRLTRTAIILMLIIPINPLGYNLLSMA